MVNTLLETLQLYGNSYATDANGPGTFRFTARVPVAMFGRFTVDAKQLQHAANGRNRRYNVIHGTGRYLTEMYDFGKATRHTNNNMQHLASAFH
jgi:hypothetical protein